MGSFHEGDVYPVDVGENESPSPMVSLEILPSMEPISHV